MIDTHQELVIALAEAAELEHSLICQYLFAAYSVKTDAAADGLSAADVATFGRWRGAILNVARQEMGHLGTVWNIAALVGAAPHLGRANFPQAAGHYYPPNIAFSLEPLGQATLRRFVEFERPIPPDAIVTAEIAPEPLVYSRVGDLYRQIKRCVGSLPDAELLANPKLLQDSRSWSNNVTLMTAVDRQQVLDAIEFIIEQGEGTSQGSAGSHFAIFKGILSELEQRASGAVTPARSVIANPSTQRHRDASGAAIVDHAVAARAMDLFSALYSDLMIMLRQYYSFSGETDEERLVLRGSAFQTMHGCLAPLGEAITRLPAFADGRAGVAGPSFEMYGDETLSTLPSVVWPIVARRMRSAQREAEGLTQASPNVAAFGVVAVKAAEIADNLETGLST